MVQSDSRGPLPPNWEAAYSENGEKYFIEYIFLLFNFSNIILLNYYLFFLKDFKRLFKIFLFYIKFNLKKLFNN